MFQIVVKGQGQIFIIAFNCSWYILFVRSGVIFGTIIVYGVYMTTKFSDCQYDLEIKDQSIIYSICPMIRDANSFYIYFAGRCLHS